MDRNHFCILVDLDKVLNGLKTLTPREYEVLNQVVFGQRNREIASELGITIRTVKEHRVRIMKKMQAHSFAELITMIVTVRLMKNRESLSDSDRGVEMTARAPTDAIARW
jgi:DNA-binding CsgD family transcriptional regulator